MTDSCQLLSSELFTRLPFLSLYLKTLPNYLPVIKTLQITDTLLHVNGVLVASFTKRLLLNLV